MADQNEKWMLLGASKGLGLAFHEVLKKHRPLDIVTTMSRQAGGFDFSKESRWPEYVQEILKFQPTRLVYFAAGGPYGHFEKFEWKDHEWSLRVSFLFPAFLIHLALRGRSTSPQNWKNLQQMVFIGSSIAESQPDPGAAAYCASKHALRALIETIHLEQANTASPAALTSDVPGNSAKIQIKLFSPGYMNTGLLPQGSWPREQGIAVDPHLEALKLYDEVFTD